MNTCCNKTMIIRATTNLLSIARIKPVKMEASITGPLPGEWYASLLSTGRKGGSVIHFLHHPTLISVLVMGRSLNKALDVLPVRVHALLNRNGFSDLAKGFELFTIPEVVTTNSRSLLASMTQLKFDLEYNLALLEEVEPAELIRMEDKYLTYLFGGKIAKAASKAYIQPLDQLKQLQSDSE